MISINPATGDRILEYTQHSESQISDIIDANNAAGAAWRESEFHERSRLMIRVAEVLRRKREVYARLMTMEMGKLIGESRSEIDKCAWVCEYYAENAQRFLADEIVETDASRSLITYEPLGTVLAIMPWNFPFWQVFRFAAPTLMAGNGGLLKHASNVPGSALAIESIFREAGLPADLFRTLLIPASEVEAVIENKHVKAVTLTGSEPAGMEVAAIAGRELKKTVMELGGADAFIVLEDADLSRCVPVSVQARMINAGQSCIAAKRFIVVESQLAEFEKLQTEMMSSLRIGDPLNEASQVAPLARLDLREELHSQISQTLDSGARLLTGGEMIPGPGAYYNPTVISAVSAGMPLYSEETFGPVAAIIPVADTEEAIAVANDSEFGLGGSLWTRDLEKGEALARRIESGGVFINGMTKSDPRLPFGGIKRSGYGRELGVFGIREFVNIKSIWIA